VIAEPEVIRKALAAVCAEVSDGGPADFSGSIAHGASSVAHEASLKGTEGASEPGTRWRGCTPGPRPAPQLTRRHRWPSRPAAGATLSAVIQLQYVFQSGAVKVQYVFQS
jgi:hypothetical protein